MQPRNMSMSGVVDLAAVKAAGEARQKAEQARAETARQGGAAPVSPVSLVIDVDEAGFERDVIQRSAEVPVVIDFWAEWCEPCKQLGPLLERLAVEYNGRFLLAKVDVDANQMLMQQFGIQGIPAVFAVVAGQALPLFQGAAPEAQIRQTLDQLIQVGEERFGITGIPVDPEAEPPAADAEPAEVPAAPMTHCSKRPYRRWTPMTSTARSRRTGMSSRRTRPTRRPSSASPRPNCSAGSRVWTPSRSGRTRPTAPPMSRRRSPRPTSIWWAVISRTPSAVWSRRCSGRWVTTARPHGSICSSSSK